MKPLLAFLTALAALSAQPLPQLRIEAVDAGSMLYIKNISAIPLTAFMLELVDYPGSSFTFYRDEVTNGGIAPGVEQKYRITNMTVGAAPDYVKVQAAVYQDGGSSGIPAKVALILSRRATELDITRELIQRVEKDVSNKDALMSVLKQSADTKKLARGVKLNSPEGARQDAAFETISGAIRSLNEHSPQETLQKLRDDENKIAQSHPALPRQVIFYFIPSSALINRTFFDAWS